MSTRCLSRRGDKERVSCWRCLSQETLSRYAFNVVAGEVPGVLDKLEEEDSCTRGRKRVACGCHEVLLYLVNSARPRWRSRWM